MIKEFKWKFPSYEKNLIPKDGELIEWLSIMQHFGAPTRLLDVRCLKHITYFIYRIAQSMGYADEFTS